jgi:hypothetical protein
MKKIGVLIVLLVGALIAPSAIGQHEHQNSGQAAPEASSQEGAPARQMGSMMSGGMMSGGMETRQQMSGGMNCPNQEMKKLVAQVVTSFQGIQNEQDPGLLKSKIAEHAVLLSQLQKKSEEKCPMMEMMEGHTMTHPKEGEEHK